MTDETYEGWTNRETWAFNLHWSNDEGLYDMVREWGQELTRSEDEEDELSLRDFVLGEAIIERMKDFIDDYKENFGSELPEGLAMYRDEVGSWWRIDAAEIGASVRESL